MKKVGQTYLMFKVTIMLIFLFIVGVFVCWYFFPEEVLDIEGVYNLEVKEEYKVGEIIEYELEFCKLRAIRGDHDAVIVNGKPHFYKTDLGTAPVGCYDFIESIYIVPDLPSNGGYHLEIFVSYKANPIKSITYHFVSNEFEIVK